MAIKTAPRRIRGKTVAVDTQVLEWRKKLKKEGIILGRHMAKQVEITRRERLSRETNTDEKLRKKRWF